MKFATVLLFAATCIAAPISTDSTLEPLLSDFTLYTDSHFNGQAYTFNYYTLKPEGTVCINVHEVANDIASSARWSRYFGGYITFFKNIDCDRFHDVYKEWWMDTDSYPTDFSLDGINDSISSVRIWRTYNRQGSPDWTPDCPLRDRCPGPWAVPGKNQTASAPSTHK